MRLRGILIAAMTCTLAFGTAASAEAKPQDAKPKHCTKKDKKLRCTLTGGETVTGVCPAGYDPATVIELGPGAELSDLNGNAILCYGADRTLVDDTPAS